MLTQPSMHEGLEVGGRLHGLRLPGRARSGCLEGSVEEADLVGASVCAAQTRRVGMRCPDQPRPG